MYIRMCIPVFFDIGILKSHVLSRVHFCVTVYRDRFTHSYVSGFHIICMISSVFNIVRGCKNVYICAYIDVFQSFDILCIIICSVFIICMNTYIERYIHISVMSFCGNFMLSSGDITCVRSQNSRTSIHMYLYFSKFRTCIHPTVLYYN